jgi:hypothetical protein
VHRPPASCISVPNEVSSTPDTLTMEQKFAFNLYFPTDPTMLVKARAYHNRLPSGRAHFGAKPTNRQ